MEEEEVILLPLQRSIILSIGGKVTTSTAYNLEDSETSSLHRSLGGGGNITSGEKLVYCRPRSRNLATGLSAATFFDDSNTTDVSYTAFMRTVF